MTQPIRMPTHGGSDRPRRPNQHADRRECVCCDNRSMLKVGVLIAFAGLCTAADYPDPVEGDFTIRDFHFHDGEVMPELRLHYTTVGNPSNPPVLIMHGTGGLGHGFLSAGFAGELLGPGQPLDAKKYF